MTKKLLEPIQEYLQFNLSWLKSRAVQKIEN